MAEYEDEGPYDVIVLGTGLEECILSGLFAVQGKKVLNVDANDYYGGESTTLNPLSKAFAILGTDAQKKKDLKAFGKERDWAVDVVPKMILANGELLKTLIYTQVDKYLDFRSAGVAFTVKQEKSMMGKISTKIHKLPATKMEAGTTSLLSFFEKGRFKGFLEFVQAYKPDKQSSWIYKNNRIEPKTSMQSVYSLFNLDTSTQDFVGHSVALYTNDEYKTKPCGPTFAKVSLFFESMFRYDVPDRLRSPWIYPAYGLGDLTQGFSRMSAVYGSVYKLDYPVDEILVDDNGKVRGIKSGETEEIAPMIIGEPKYFPEKVKKVGEVVRAYCLLSHPVGGIDGRESAQICIPFNQLRNKRKNDIFISVLCAEQCVCPKGRYVATVSTISEGNGSEKQQLAEGLELLGAIDEIFFSRKDVFHPKTDGKEDNIFITKSYDATLHFESSMQDIRNVYERATGQALDLDKIKIPSRDGSAQ